MPLSATLEFIGAAQQVTGSCYLIKLQNKQILLDCGMVQGAEAIAAGFAQSPPGFAIAWEPDGGHGAAVPACRIRAAGLRRWKMPGRNRRVPAMQVA